MQDQGASLPKRLGHLLLHMELETQALVGGVYWLVNIVVPPIGLQTPLAPWVLFLFPLLGALFSFSPSLSFLLRKCTDLFESLLYPDTLKFIRFASFPVKLLWSLINIILLSANRDILTSSFTICIVFTSLCYLIALARSSTIVLNR